MSNNLYHPEPQLIDFNNNLTQKPNYYRTQSQPDPSLNPRAKEPRRRVTTGSIYDKNSTSLFWTLVGRENYTTSLNNSPVLCNSYWPPDEYYFTNLVNKFGSFPWRSKKFSSRTVPTMIPKSDGSSINLLTTKFRGIRSSPASITSTFLGSLDKSTKRNSTPPAPQQEEVTIRKSLMEPIELRGRNTETEPVLEIDMAEQIRQQLPRRVRLSPSWNLLYSLDQDGTSMTTMYHKVKDKGPVIIAIKDVNEQVFGAFVSESLKQCPSYYGNGECFLWKMCPKENETSLPKVKFYLWSGRNQYMVLSEHNYLSIGGGDGRAGLWIDSDLESGTSARCDTFDNDILSSTPEFDCIGFEVWGFN